MTDPIRTSRGVGRYVANETDLVLGTRQAWTGDKRPLVYVHGSGDNVDTIGNKSAQGPLVRALAQYFTVGVADLGLETFGNDLSRTRIGQEITHLSTNWGSGELPVLVAQSAGALAALGYLLDHPTGVAAVALTIPALDIADVYAATTGGPVPGLIDAAYGGAYSDATHGPTHSPVQYAASLPNVPIAMWCANNDDAARPGPVNVFKAARPATELTWVGNLGHTEAAVTAASAALLAWCAARA